MGVPVRGAGVQDDLLDDWAQDPPYAAEEEDEVVDGCAAEVEAADWDLRERLIWREGHVSAVEDLLAADPLLQGNKCKDRQPQTQKQRNLPIGWAGVKTIPEQSFLDTVPADLQ